MLLHDELNGNVGINIERIGDVVLCAAFSEKTHAFSAAACAADLDDNTRIKIFVQFIYGLSFAYRIEAYVKILAVYLPYECDRMLNAGEQYIHIVFVKESTQIVIIYPAPLDIVVMYIAADIFGAVYSCFVAVNLNPKRIDKTGIPYIAPYVFKLIKLRRSQFIGLPGHLSEPFFKRVGFDAASFAGLNSRDSTLKIIAAIFPQGVKHIVKNLILDGIFHKTLRI